MTSRTQKQIGYVYPGNNNAYSLSCWAGVMAYAQQAVHFAHVVDLHHSNLAHPPFLNKLCGLIVSYNRIAEPAQLVEHLQCPIVNIVEQPKDGRCPTVTCDDELIGRLAAEELLRLGFDQWAVVHCPSSFGFSNLRREGFCQAIRAQRPGARIPMFEVPLNHPSKDLYNLQRNMDAWVEQLPPKVAVFCVFDNLAVPLVNAARNLQRPIPTDLAILGVGNDPLVSRIIGIPLSSVDQDGYQVGFEAARAVDSLLSGQPLEGEVKLMPPAGVRHRRTTDVTHIPDEDFKQAIETIHNQFDLAIDLNELALNAKMSRRNFDRKLKVLLGMPPYEYILMRRVERAKRLLADTDRPIKEIALNLGFHQPRALCVAFKRMVEQTPSEYREAHQHAFLR